MERLLLPLLITIGALLSGCGGNNTVPPPERVEPSAPEGGNADPEPPSATPCALATGYRISPADGATNIPPRRPIRIELDGSLLPDELDRPEAAVALTSDDGSAIPLDIRLDRQRCAIEILPRQPLHGGRAHTLTLDLAALTGNDTAPTALTRRFTTMPVKFLGASFFNSELPEIDRLTASDLLGMLRFGGRWVTELALPEKNPAIVVPDSYLDALHRFCEYATARQQKTLVQIPLFLPDAGLRRALTYLRQRDDRCNLVLFAIGNEVDRMDSDEEQYAERFEWPDYLAALRRIVPLLREHFPDAAITALDLSSFEEYDGYRALREWVDPFCGSDDPAVREIDFLSIHFYPYTGAQKLWDMLGMGRVFADDLAQLPPGCPPLLLGEHNTTYQWRPGSTYPGSGGDAFIPLLTLPEVLHRDETIGLLHWSLIEDATSTLGLFQQENLAARPVYPGYLMLRDIENSRPLAATVSRGDLAASAFEQDDKRLILFLGNHRPLYRRDITIGATGGNDVTIADGPLPRMTIPALPPFSLTRLDIDREAGIVASQHISYHSQNMTPGLPASDSTLHCIPVADFSEPNKSGPDFVGPDYDQNRKIATAGTPLPVAFGPGRNGVSVMELGGVLETACTPAAGRSACGVSLPLIGDVAMQNGTEALDWSEGIDSALFRLTLATPGNVPIRLQAQLGQNHPAREADIASAPAAAIDLPGDAITEILLPLRDFAPPPGSPLTLGQRLTRLAALHLLTTAPDAGGAFHVHRIEICDRLTPP